MADLTMPDATDVAPVKVIEQMTGPAAAAIDAGTPVYMSTTTGQFTAADASAAPTARCCGIAITTTSQANESMTVVRKGWLDMGDALGDLTYDDDVYLSDTVAVLADGAGTVSLIVGTVVPAFIGTTPDKLLRVDL